HVSELERGLGVNGPTLATLDRILHELGDALVVDTKNEQARREATAIASAEAAVGGIGARLDPAVGSPGALRGAIRDWSALRTGADDNPYARLLVDGVLTGLYVALTWMGAFSSKDLQAVRREIEKPLADDH